MILGLPAELARRQAKAYLRGTEPAAAGSACCNFRPDLAIPITAMAREVSTLHQIPAGTEPARKGTPMLAPAAGGLAAVALLGALALWFHYGTTVFFETIAAGISACF